MCVVQQLMQALLHMDLSSSRRTPHEALLIEQQHGNSDTTNGCDQLCLSPQHSGPGTTHPHLLEAPSSCSLCKQNKSSCYS